MFCGFPLGAVLGGAASTKLIEAFGWPSVFYLGGALPLLLVPVIAAWLPESLRYMVQRDGGGADVARICGRVERRRRFAPDDRYVVDDVKLLGMPVKHLFRDRRGAGTLAMWLVFFCNLLLIYFLINWLPAVLVDAGIALDGAIIGIVALNAGGIAGGLVQGWLIDRRGAFGVLAAGYAAGAALIALIGFASGNVAALMAVIALAGFCVLGTQFGMNALAANYYPTSIRATGVGWALGIGRIGSIVGPVLGGAVLALGWTTREIFLATALPALVAAGGVVAIKILADRDRRAEEEAPPKLAT
jgi:AAHS family 4-hydroxybenzoate transporter-like MFS transporter